MAEQLALLGGSPTCSPPMRWSWPPRYPGMGEALRDYVDSGEPLSVQGREGIIGACEDELRTRFERRHALLCSSGTMALYSAYFALGVRPGDEIICPTITYHATASPALHLGAKVVLVDVEPDTGNIDVEAAEAAIGPHTVAVATNAMWGHPVEQAAVQDLCDRNRLAWVEDISHAHFAEYKHHPVGAFGDIACASLQGSKLISGGEGGVFLTDDDELYRRAVLLGHNLRRSNDLCKGTDYEDIGRTGYGLKLRCHPLAAVLIHDQLIHHARRWVSERRQSLDRISARLARLRGVEVPTIKPYVTSLGAAYGYKPRIHADRLGIGLAVLLRALQAEGLDVELPGSPPLHRLALFDPNRFPVGTFAKADNLTSSYPGATAYAAGRVSCPTPTGEQDRHVEDALILGFEKVWRHLEELRLYEPRSSAKH